MSQEYNVFVSVCTPSNGHKHFLTQWGSSDDSLPKGMMDLLSGQHYHCLSSVIYGMIIY